MRNSKTMVAAVVVVLFFFPFINCIAAGTKAKNGQWQGDVNKSLSFVVENDMIKEFKMWASRSSFEQCRVKISQIPIEKNGAFFLKGPDDNFSISGKFTTPTTVQGKIIIKYCAPSAEGGKAAVFLVPLEREWTAKPK